MTSTMINTVVSENAETLNAAEVLRAFLAAKYYMEIVDANTLRHINTDIDSFCARRREIEPLIAVISENRGGIILRLRD